MGRIELLDRSSQRILQLAQLGSGGRLVDGARDQLRLVVVNRQLLAAAVGTALKEAVALVDRDPIDPSTESGIGVKAVDGAPAAQQCILGNLLGVGRVHDHTQDDRVDPVTMGADEILIGSEAFEIARRVLP